MDVKKKEYNREKSVNQFVLMIMTVIDSFHFYFLVISMIIGRDISNSAL